MRKPSAERATLFTPGRSSYLDADGRLRLSPNSIRRALVARDTYDWRIHDAAVFAGGFPGLTQNWPPEQTPPASQREAYLMASYLVARLDDEGVDEQDIRATVKAEGDSSNSFGDVITSIEQGLLTPETFGDPHHELQIVAGALHGQRFRMLLSKALDLDPRRITRVPMHDTYGSAATHLFPAESPQRAIVKELGAIELTAHVLRHVKRGDLEGMKNAEQAFIERYKQHLKSA